MRNSPIAFLIFALLATLATIPSIAQDLTILTEEDPPYNFMGQDGKPTGFAVELTVEIQRRLGTRETITIFPWARAYHTIQDSPAIVLFTMARTKEREPMFQWVGPIIENRWILVGLRKADMKVPTLADAKKLNSIGVVQDFAWDRYLTERGFPNLDRTTTNAQNILKLLAGRIQTYVSSDNTWASEIAAAGQKAELFEELLVIESVQLYIAHSKTTDKAVADRWQKTLNTMKADGTFARILLKWFPGHKLPGPARKAEF